MKKSSKIVTFTFKVIGASTASKKDEKALSEIFWDDDLECYTFSSLQFFVTNASSLFKKVIYHKRIQISLIGITNFIDFVIFTNFVNFTNLLTLWIWRTLWILWIFMNFMSFVNFMIFVNFTNFVNFVNLTTFATF